MAKRISKYFIVLILSLCIVSCSDDKQSSQANVEVSKDFAPVSKSIGDLQDEISRNIILGSSDNRSRQLTKSYLVDLKNLLTYLTAYPKDKAQLYRALEIAKKLEDLPLPLSDRARLNPIIESYNQAIAKHAASVNIDISKFNWSLFTYDFNDGLAPFWTEASKATWITTDGNAVNSQTKATARASKFDLNKAWLVTPQLDFTNITNPELQLRHSIQISRGDEPLNTAEVLRNGYKILVTDKYNYGDELLYPKLNCPELVNLASLASLADPTVFVDLSQCVDETIWEEIEVEKPKGDDFHTITTAPASLKKYAGKKNVFIALLLNLDSAGTRNIGKHFNNWSVYEVKILGSGVLPKPINKPPPPKLPEPIFFYDFPNSNLAPLLTFNTDPSANNWRYGTFKDFRYASMTTENGPNTSYTANLVHPEIDLTTESESLFLSIDHSVRPAVDTYDFWQRFKLKISTDYIEGNDPSTATWTEFEIKTNDKIRYDAFNKLSKYGIDISEYANQKISLNFEFTAEVNDNHLWQVNQIMITLDKREAK